METKEIYLITISNCFSCKIQFNLLSEALKEKNDIYLEAYDHLNAPEFIKNNIKFTDFPLTVLVKNNVIIDHFVGTKSVNKFNKLLEAINF